MTASVTIKLPHKIKKKEFDQFCAKNDIKKFRGNYRYKSTDYVKVVFGESEVVVSSSDKTKMAVAFIAKKILARYGGVYSCDDVVEIYMPKEFKEKI